ncbi:LPXTG cell wall anchor domain-containing protein [Enterococcus faecalis]
MKKIVYGLGVFFFFSGCLWGSNQAIAASIHQERSNVGITFNGYEDNPTSGRTNGYEDNPTSGRINGSQATETQSSNHKEPTTLPRTNERKSAVFSWAGLLILTSVSWGFYQKKKQSMEETHDEK